MPSEVFGLLNIANVQRVPAKHIKREREMETDQSAEKVIVDVTINGT